MSKKVKSDKTKPEDKTKLESTTKPEDNIKLEDVFIANPLYDPVFKYLMSDNISARKLLSAIIGKEVIELSFAPQEHVENVDVQEQSYIICRLDFTALIRTESGSLAVMIEVQKVHYHNDIIRFRRYLGGQYQNKDYVYDDSEGRRHVRQIYCIFFIGDGVGIKNAPVIEINPIAKDVTTEKNLQVQNNEFVLSLHHRSWIVQVPELKKYRRNDLERLLGIFDQTNTIENRHILNIKSEKFPKEYHPIIRRLQMAAKNEKVRNAMQAEDDILEHFKIEE
ncbi:MAG: hypothetical protein LBR10_08615, partial [Prevotellaceae bacterium]|nr:hypothetical protein [Prevotellaceae bacterium]